MCSVGWAPSRKCGRDDASPGKKHCLAREPDNPGDIAYGCGNRQPRYTIDGINILVSFEDTEEEEIDLINDERKRMLSAEEAHTILSEISVRDMERMGLIKPRNPRHFDIIHSCLLFLPLGLFRSNYWLFARSGLWFETVRA